MEIAVFKADVLEKGPFHVQRDGNAIKLPGSATMFSLPTLPADYSGQDGEIYTIRAVARIPAKLKPYQYAVLLPGVIVGDRFQIREQARNRPVSEVRARLIQLAKEMAGEKIVERYPLTTQMNMNMRATELQELRILGGTLSAAEQVESDALKAVASWIKNVRQASNDIEAAIGTMTISELQSYDLGADPKWP